MKKYSLIISLLVVAFVVTISSCKKNDDPVLNESVILIDSIVHPDTINFGEKLEINYYGVIGDGCDYFSRFEEIPLAEGEFANTFKIKVWKYREDAANCSEQLKYLTDAQIGLTGMLAGDFLIKVVQPDGSELTGEVFIKE